jgi:hypothetical protein
MLGVGCWELVISRPHDHPSLPHRSQEDTSESSKPCQKNMKLSNIFGRLRFFDTTKNMKTTISHRGRQLNIPLFFEDH